jgi:glycosyltransferase involved in cell wall biosynthesis
MKLSILICTLPERARQLALLRVEIFCQSNECKCDYEILDDNTTGITIGEKRNRLAKRATGDYVVFHDDDDPLQPDYVSEIWKAIQSGVDIIGLRGFMTTNGAKRVPFRIDYGLPYDAVGNEYHRHHNHLCPIKREIALQIGYKDMNYGEDYDYAVRLKDSGLIKTHAFIDKEIYHYDFRTDKTRPR